MIIIIASHTGMDFTEDVVLGIVEGDYKVLNVSSFKSIIFLL